MSWLSSFDVGNKKYAQKFGGEILLKMLRQGCEANINNNAEEMGFGNRSSLGVGPMNWLL